MIVDISNHDCFESFFRHFLLELVLFGDVSDTSKLQEQTNDLGYSLYKLLSGLVVVPVLAILFLARLHVWTASVRSIFWAVSFIFAFSSIANAPSLITENLLSLTPFSWDVCGVVYYSVNFFCSHSLCNFYWCSPALSQRRYLTRVPCDIIFSKNSFMFFGSWDFVFLRNSRNNGCNRLLRRSSTNSQSNTSVMDQLCPQKSFPLAVTLFYTSYFLPHVLLTWIVRNHRKLAEFLLTWHRERYMLYATTFLPDVSTYVPRWYPSHLIGPDSYAILIFRHLFLFSFLVDW